MWQRFTDKARRVIFNAQDAAQQYGHKYVSTEHLLLGLVREPDNVACRALRTMEIELGAITPKVEALAKPGDFAPEKDITLTPRGKRVIDLAYDEARKLGNNYIGTEHLLLGLIRETDGIAGRVLSELGVGLERTRHIVMTIHEESGREGKDAPKASPRQEHNPWLRVSRNDLITTLLFQMRRGCHTGVIAAAAASDEGSAGAALLFELGLNSTYVRLPLEIHTESIEMLQALRIDDLLASAALLVSEGKTLNSAHLFAAIAMQNCPPLESAMGDAAERLKAKVAAGPF